MLTMHDLRSIANSSTVNNNCGTLSAPLFVLLFGNVARTEEAHLRDMLRKRWSNADSYLYIASLQAGHGNASVDTRYTIDADALRQYGQKQLYWALTTCLNHFMNLICARPNFSLRDVRLTAVISSTDEEAFWAAPALAILTELICAYYDGSVSDRSVYVYLDTYSPQANDTRPRLRKELSDNLAKAPQDEMLFMNDSRQFRRCNNFITHGLFDRVVCLSQQINGIHYDQDGERNHFFGALVDPQSDIQWAAAQQGSLQTEAAYSACIYLDNIERGVDVLIVWRKVHERFANSLSTQNPDESSLKEACAELFARMDQICRNVARDMHGFAPFNDMNMQEFISQLNTRKGKPSESIDMLENHLFAAALKNKYDYLWIRELKGAETTAAQKKWRSETNAWLKHVWNAPLSDEKCREMLQYTPRLGGASNSSSAPRSATPESIRDWLIEQRYDAHRPENTKKAQAHLDTLANELVAANAARRSALATQIPERLNALSMRIENVQAEYLNEYANWTSNPGTIFDKRHNEITNIPSALNEAYEQAVNAADLDVGLQEFLKKAAEWVQTAYPTLMPLPTPDSNMMHIACTLSNTFAAPTGKAGRIAGGMDVNRFYYIQNLALKNVMNFG